MKNHITLKDKLNSFNKTINIEGDKSLSIRWVLLASLSSGISRSHNLLMSEDVIAAIETIKKFGIKVKIKKNLCKIYGKGINGYQIKKNHIINAKNSGTLARLILGLLVNYPKKIKLIGDQSLSKRDFTRIADPLSKFGAKFKLNQNKGLPLTIIGKKMLKPIKFFENTFYDHFTYWGLF